MTPRMVEVSRWDGKDWAPRATGVFHGFYTDYVELQAGIGNYPATMVEEEEARGAKR